MDVINLVFFFYRTIFVCREIIEDGINSVENQVECLIPDIPVHSPEMMAFIKDEPPIQCDDTEPWVNCGIDEHVSSVNPSADEF